METQTKYAHECVEHLIGYLYKVELISDLSVKNRGAGICTSWFISKPVYMSKKIVEKMQVKRVGDYYYTHDFAIQLFREALIHRGNFNKVHMAMVSRAVQGGCDISCLMPAKATQWEKLVADVFQSPAVQELKKALMVECECHCEYKSISIDGTMKPCFTLLGQPSYLASKIEKAKHATPLKHQKHTLLTGLGLSGAVLILKTAYWENTPDIMSIILATCTPSQLLQIVHFAFDTPSKKLYDALKAACANFVYLSLCVPHLAFVYEAANWEKSSPGSLFLRCILKKVTSITGSHTNVSTQSAYCGDGDRELTIVEKAKVRRVQFGTMGLQAARKLQKNLDSTRAFDSRGQYMDCLAALVVLYPDEVKKTHSSQRKLKDILATSCYPDRLEYMLNEARFVRKLPAAQREYFQSGVCGNEAFHRETANMFNGLSMHPATLDMKLEHLQTRKLLAHNVALYHPTVKPMTEVEVVHRRVSSLDPWLHPNTWEKWCDASDVRQRGHTPPQMLEHAAQKARLRDWTAQTKATEPHTAKSMKAMKKLTKSSIFGKSKKHDKLRR